MFPSLSLLSSGGHNTPQHTPKHPYTPHTLPCLYILKCVSLRINWRASVNLLIDQVSALVPTLFFVIVTLHLRRSLHPPLFVMVTCFCSSTRHSQAKCQEQDCLYKHVSFILSVVIRRTQHTPTHPKTPLHTPHSPMPIHPQVSVTQNQLESQCKSAH